MPTVVKGDLPEERLQQCGEWKILHDLFIFCKMADQDVATLFQHIASQLAALSTAVGTQGISQIVHPLEGDSKIF